MPSEGFTIDRRQLGVLGAGLAVAASGLGAIANLVPQAKAAPVAPETGPIKVGILHSLSGTMAISEVPLKDVMMMLIAEQNKKGGIMGRTIQPVVVDPASNWPLFAEKARQLLAVDKVAAVFGCWTSVSRKSVLPVFEQLNGILLYPVQYEGQECSRNVFYTGAAPNQQAIPAVDYLMNQVGVKRWVLEGTDYVYPRTTNKILEAYLKSKGVAPADLMINYTPFGYSDWQAEVAKIKGFGSAGKKTAVVSTINGDANVPFYKELGNQSIKATDIPVVAFSVGEQELAGIDTKPLVGHLAAWNYFESVDTPLNKEVVADFKKFMKNDKRVFNDPMEAHYIGFNMWVKAVEKAGGTDHDAVIDAMIGVAHPNLTGDYATMMPNHHLTKPVLIGEVQGDGMFNVVWQTPGLVVAQPWSPYLPESKNLIGDWLPPMSCGSYDVVAGKCLGEGQGLINMRSGSGECRRRLRLLLLGLAPGALLMLVLILAGPTLAGSDPFADIAASNFDTVAHGVSVLAVSGSPRAIPVIDALRDGRLFAWRWPRPDAPLYIRTANGFADARSGASVAAPPPMNLRLVIVNDSVRSAIATGEGALGLTSPKQAVRLAAAEALFQSAEADALPLIDRALARERDPAVAGMLREARAAALLKSGTGDVSARLAAVHELAVRADLSTRSLLASMQGQPAPVAAAIQGAIRDIDRRLQLWGLLENVYYGISLGAVLLLAAAGLAITFGVMGVINMAHGEMVMIGAYTTFVVQQVVEAFAPALTNLGLLFAVPAAFLVAGALGVLIERTLIRFLYGRPLETLLATWGLSLILQQAVRSIFGPTNQDVSSPPWMSGAVNLGGLTLTVNRLWIILFAALVLGALMAALRWGGLGRSIRAVMQNRRMAAVMGIRTPLIDALTFGLGSGIAGIAGVALSQIDNVSPNLGQNYIIDSFMVVVLGGVGNLWGTVVGAMTLGVVDKLVEPFAGAVLGKILVLVLLILFIQRRPRGLFPLKGRVAEA